MGIAKASIRNLATNRSIEVPFNPEEYALDSGNVFKPQAVPKGRPTLQYTGTNLRKLQMDLFVDTSQSQTDVRTQVQPILDLLEKDPATDAPPFLLFTWGSFHFRCLLESVSQRYTQFLTTGSPVRAYLKLSFVESEAPGSAAEAGGAPAPQAVHTVREGENLSQIAAQTTGDPKNWRQIATENRIDNPLKLSSPMALKLPQGATRFTAIFSSLTRTR
jgi:hypothetical protein